jgi:hypothetical protein
MSNQEIAKAQNVAGNNIANLRTGTALTSPISDGWDTVPETGGHIRGSAITINGNTGAYAVNKVDTILGQRQFAVTGVLTAWVCWLRGSQRPEILVTQSGQRHPHKEELRVIPQEQWPEYAGVPQFPWRDSRYVYLADPQTGEEFTVILNTWRGRAAVGDLKTATMNIRMSLDKAFAIITLGTQMRRDQFGEKPGPKFNIVEWRQPASAADEAPKALAQEMNDDLPF